MKPILSTILLLLLPLSALHGQDSEPAKREPYPFEQKFTNLPKEQREDFQIKLIEAQRLFNQKRIFDAIEKAQQANEVFAESPDVHNLLGACQVEFRAFDKAMKHFEEAEKLAPNLPSILFNIAELNFVTKDWKAAETNLAKLLHLMEVELQVRNLQIKRLVEFKLLLAKLSLEKTDEVKALAEKYDYLDDSPYPYFAEAALAYSEKRDADAETTIARAVRIFQNPAAIAPWQDTLIEYGFIKGFFGGDQDDKAAK